MADPLARLKAISSEAKIALLLALESAGEPASQDELAGLLKKSVSAVSRSLISLCDAGFVFSTSSKQGLRYELTQVGANAIAFLFDRAATNVGGDQARTPAEAREPLKYRRPGERNREARRRRGRRGFAL